MKRIHQFSRYSLSILLITITTGCATTDYGCKGMPDEPSCLSTTQAYQVTNTAITETPPENSQDLESASIPTLIPPLQQPVPNRQAIALMGHNPFNRRSHTPCETERATA
jgi:conjugal transfer pilus assembly protein TraV